MKKKIILFIATLLLLITNCVPVFAAESAWVLDETGVLSQETIDYVDYLNEEVFPNYQNKPQLGIMIIDSLPYGYTMDEYKLEQFNSYGVGTKKENCGLLFVMAISDREYGLEIGDGYVNGSLLRKDLETDFITSDMKQLMREENYDQAVFQIVQHLESVMADEENGVYVEREEERRIEQEKADAQMRVFIKGLGICCAIGIIIYFIRKLVKYLLLVSRVNSVFNSYEHLLRYIKCPVKDLKKDIIHRLYSRETSAKMDSDVLYYVYKQYINEMTDILKNTNLTYNYDYYRQKLNEINTYDVFVKSDVLDIDYIIRETDVEQMRKQTIYDTNISKIRSYIEANKAKIDEDRVSISDLEHKIAKNCRDFVEMSDKEIEDYFKKALKQLEFKYEYKQFLESCEGEINSRFFNESKFYSELERSQEYAHYSGGRIRNNAWMMLLLTQHMNKNKQDYEHKQRLERQRQSQTHSSSYGHSFGGGFSSGGGFHGGW